MHNFSPLLQLAPLLFCQLYAIHGYLCGRLLLLVYCSIFRKSEDIYGEIFDVVLRHLPHRPKSMSIDFETAVENAVKQKLSMTPISFCFFHFKKALKTYKLVPIELIIKIIVLDNPIDILS